ncbi:helix-turn-helix domain-containing protein [Staphylococcus hominis]|uniref:helix-turn-helix domain-containing protein n=1 Tax=Staphylococcus hominis TaxID=1290 RepID=UPI00080B56B0|nr:helix-turn-helix transcriptional regulator [Staphylococcus hominis]
MKFGEILKKEREGFNVSVKKLSELSLVSTAYISKLENNKRGFPSIETIYNLIFGFKNLIEERYGSEKGINEVNDEYLKELLSNFLNASDSNLKNENSDLAYKDFVDFYNKKMDIILNDNSKNKEAIFLNKIQLTKGTTNKIEIDKPFFDLNWLLSQNDYEVFYGRDFIFDKNLFDKKSLNERDMYFYNVLTKSDLRTIKNLIEVFLENKYFRIKQEKVNELFNIFTNKKNINYNQFLNIDYIEFLKSMSN